MYPARFQLIAAMNPCRCGNLGDSDLECTRAPRCAVDYQTKISGPLLDRIDLRVDVTAVPVVELHNTPRGEDSAHIAARIVLAREKQALRYAQYKDGMKGTLNADTPPDILEKIAILQEDSRDLLNSAAERLKLSARGYHRVLRVARTIADLESGTDDITREISKAHIAEALGYRPPRLN